MFPQSFQRFRLAEIGPEAAYVRQHNALLAALDQHRLSITEGGPLRLQQLANGQLLSVNQLPGTASDLAARHFYVMPGDAGTGTVNVTGGVLQHPTLNQCIHVAAAAGLAVADADAVWLERTGNHAWSFNAGAVVPADKLYILLVALVAVDEGDNVTIDPADYEWAGGDMILFETFPVDLESDGGTAGNDTTLCSFTYTVTALGGAELLTGAAPLVSMARVVPGTATAATAGTCRILKNGSLVLWDCDETQANTVTQKNLTELPDCA